MPIERIPHNSLMDDAEELMYRLFEIKCDPDYDETAPGPLMCFNVSDEAILMGAWLNICHRMRWQEVTQPDAAPLEELAKLSPEERLSEARKWWGRRMDEIFKADYEQLNHLEHPLLFTEFDIPEKEAKG